MKKIIQVIILVLCVACLHACQEEKGEVVSQDWAYQLDQDYIYVDIPDKFQFDPSNIIYLKESATLTLNGKNNMESTEIEEGYTVTLNVKIKKPFDKDVSVRLVEDVALLDEYAGDISEFRRFPDNTFAISEATLLAGETETDITLAWANVDELNEMPGYILPLRLELADKVEGVKISTNSYSVFVKLNLMIVKENIEPSNEPIEGEFFNDIVTFESDRTKGLESLNDRVRDKNAWWTSNEQSYLTMIFPEVITIKGIRIDTNPSPTSTYSLKSLRVMVDSGDGEWLNNGVYDQGNIAGEANIKFKTPIECVRIRFEVMQSVTGKFGVDINEVTFVR